MAKRVSKVIFSKLIGFIFFLILLFVLNILAMTLGIPDLNLALQMLNNNIDLIMALFILFFIGEILEVLILPFNLLAPLFNAVGSLFLTTFIFKVFEYLESLINVNVFFIFRAFSWLIYPLVFFTVLLVGYVGIFTKKPKKKRKSKSTSWDDIGDEFRDTILDALRRIRRLFK